VNDLDDIPGRDGVLPVARPRNDDAIDLDGYGSLRQPHVLHEGLHREPTGDLAPRPVHGDFHPSRLARRGCFAGRPRSNDRVPELFLAVLEQDLDA